MTEASYVVVGNGIAGTSAAEHLRRSDRNARVTLITDEPYPLYNRIRLPFLLTGAVSEAEVFMRNAEVHKGRGIDFLPETRVTGISTEERVLRTELGREIRFQKLLVATGARPVALPGANGSARNVHYLKSLGDTKALLPVMQRRDLNVLVIGGSLIGYELAAVFSFWGLPTTWLVRGPRLFHRELNEEGGAIADRLAREAGVAVRYGVEPVEVLSRDGIASGVRTRRGETVSGDLVACGMGQTPNVGFLRGVGINVNRGVVTDKRLETSVPGIFAAGDVAEFPDPFLGALNVMGTWHNARHQGELTARNMLGERVSFSRLPFYNNHFFASRIRADGKTTRHDPNLESVSRADHEALHYCRLFFEDGRLAGSIVIGPVKFEARRALTVAVRDRVSVSDRASFLHNWWSNGLHRV